MERTLASPHFAAEDTTGIRRLPGINASFLRVFTNWPVWTIADQGIASIGNFLSGIILGRHLPQSSYGAYALLLESMLFLNSLQAALVTSPMSIRGASHDRQQLRKLSSAALGMTLALLPALGLAMTSAVFFGADLGDGSRGMVVLAASAVTAMLLWQMQETTRRALMAELRFAACVPGDALSYLGQVALLAWMAQSGRLTLPWAFVIIGSTSAVGVVVQAMQIGVARIGLREATEIARDFWKLGRWTVSANLAMVVTTVGYSWTLKFSHGLKATAAFAAMIVPLKLANPLLLGIGNLLVPAVAKVANRDGVRATTRTVGRYGLLGGAATFSYYALLFAFPAGALKLVFGAHSPFISQASSLRFYLLTMCVCYVEMVLLAWLHGLGDTRAGFLTRIVQAGVSILVSLPAIVFFGIRGLIAGEFLSMTLGAVLAIILLRRVLSAGADTRSRAS